MQILNPALPIQNESAAFVGCVWKEFFEATTPDSFQPRLSNTPSLIREVTEVAKRAATSTKWEKHLTVLQEELAAVIASDDKILREMPAYKSIAVAFTTEKAGKLIPLYAIAKRYEGKFALTLEAQLRASMATLPSAKETVFILISQWATVALQAGCPADEMSRIVLDADLGGSPEDLISKIIAAVKVGPSEVSCCVAIEGAAPDVKALSRRVGFKSVRSKVLQKADAKDFCTRTEAAVRDPALIQYVAKSIVASTPRNAATLAIRELRKAVDVFNFYSEKRLIRIMPLVLVAARSDEMSVESLGDHELRTRMPRRARALTADVLDKIPLEKLEGRILNALEHYSLAHASTATRVKLVNLWTALECLVGTNDSAIQAVCDVVCPIVAWRRSDKLLTYTATCLQELYTLNPPQALSPEMIASDGTAVSREQLLLTLAKPSNHKDILALLNFTTTQPLLKNRIFRLWQSFHNPRVVRSELATSARRIHWQLYRIYRSRNLIVHEGNDANNTHVLLDCLHYYFSITLSRILHGMQLNRGFSVDESIAFWQMKSRYLMESLEREPDCLRVHDFFAMAKTSHSSHVVWPKVVLP